MDTVFRIITTGRNCEEWIGKTLSSIEGQLYPSDKFTACVTDDCSTDGTAAIMREFEKRNPSWQFFYNTERKYALANQYNAIHSCCTDDSDVIVFVDGDDWLNGPNVLKKLSDIYSDENVLLTYGSYATNPSGLEKSQPAVRQYPGRVIQERSYREFSEKSGIYWNHLRTFRYGPFKKIELADLQYPDGRGFFTASPDTAIMTPMLELVGDRFRMVTDHLLVYNTMQAEPDWRTHLPQIQEADAIIYARPVKEFWNA